MNYRVKNFLLKYGSMMEQYGKYNNIIFQRIFYVNLSHSNN